MPPITRHPVNVEISHGVLMDKRIKNKGSVILIVVFIIALMSTIVMGMAQLNTEELLIMTNQMNSAQALESAYAGLNDAFAELYSDSSWTDGFTNKSFNSDSYTVSVTGSLPNLTLTSTATTQQGYIAKVETDVTVSSSSPYTVRVDELRINE
jgi:Tfp pilus assembly protein PilX